MTHIRANKLTQHALFATPERVMLDVQLAFLPAPGMSKKDIGSHLVQHLRRMSPQMKPLEFFSVVAHLAEHQSVRTQALQGLGYMLLGGKSVSYNFETFPMHSHTAPEVCEEIARSASELCSHEFREAAIQLVHNGGARPELDTGRLKLLLNAFQWPHHDLKDAALGALEVRDRYHPLVELWMFDTPPAISAPVKNRLDWLRQTCPSRDHGHFEPPVKPRK